ncbi:hypothetical protein Pelsub_P0907 [Pelolinea submarina]|nr:hypothetical protein Pelsub_P0907 [Pelolinea submarina]
MIILFTWKDFVHNFNNLSLPLFIWSQLPQFKIIASVSILQYLNDLLKIKALHSQKIEETL